MGSLRFFMDLILSAANGHRVDTNSNRKKPRASPGGKGGLCVKFKTLPLSCTDCLELREPQPLETVVACAGLLVIYLELP